ncbi:hypothetical protein D3C77_769200 [compost metagenome]
MFGRPIDLDDVLVDVVSDGGLLLHCSGDLLVLVDNAAHRPKNVLQRLLHLL